MSAYSDWKCGALSDDEYAFVTAMESRRDNYLAEKEGGEQNGEETADNNV